MLRILRAFCAVLLVSLSACHSVNDGHDSAPASVNQGWVLITSPTDAETFTVSTPGVTLGGKAFISPSFVCCPFEDNVSMTWMNSATGQSGDVQSTVLAAAPFPIFSREWSVGVPLILGPNAITVTAFDLIGNLGKDSITVTYDPSAGSTSGSSPTGP